MNQVQSLRDDFPILASTMRGKPFIYLDSAATSLTPEPVLTAMDRYYRGFGVNVHRGIYEFSEKATMEYEEVRGKTLSFLNLADSAAPDGHVVFTKSATESSNLIAYGWGRVFLKPGDEILTTELEHHSTLVPWHPVAEKTGAQLRFVPIDERGTFTADDFKSCLNERTKVVLVSAMSNVTGYVPPVESILRLAREAGAVTIVDGAQYISHRPIGELARHSDFLYFSAHKMLGPTGVGVLWGRTSILERMEPFLYGGDMILRVWKDRSTYHPLPEKFEAGTPNIAGVIGFGAALDYLGAVGMQAVEEHETDLIRYALERARAFPGLTVYGPGNPDMQGGILSFNLDGIHSHDVGAVLDAQGIAVRTGVHCAQPLMQHLGSSGTVRASVYVYNTRGDINALFAGLEKAASVFGR